VNEYIFVFEVEDVKVERGIKLSKLLNIQDKVVYDSEQANRVTLLALALTVMIGAVLLMINSSSGG